MSIDQEETVWTGLCLFLTDPIDPFKAIDANALVIVRNDFIGCTVDTVSELILDLVAGADHWRS